VYQFVIHVDKMKTTEYVYTNQLCDFPIECLDVVLWLESLTLYRAYWVGSWEYMIIVGQGWGRKEEIVAYFLGLVRRIVEQLSHKN